MDRAWTIMALAAALLLAAFATGAAQWKAMAGPGACIRASMLKKYVWTNVSDDLDREQGVMDTIH